MGLTSAVNWWEESQMRVLVLSSLLVQLLLLIFSFMRRCAIPRWIRSIMWLAYIAGDAVAIYALATIFNRHKQNQDPGRRGSSTLEVVWAPVLLMHLGGIDGITAYNIEDNELWNRHLVTAVSQVTVAIYVFCKSWPGGDKRLLQAAILLFICGVIKCLGKPWSLKRASINSLVSLSEAERTATQNKGERCTIEEFVEQTKTFVSSREWQRVVLPHKILRTEACKLFVDLSSPYPRRLSILKYFWLISEEKAFRSVRKGLARAFLLLYTTERTAGFPTSDSMDTISTSDAVKCLCFVMRSIRVVLPWAAIGLFHKSHREDYIDADVKITYAILCCAAILEMFSFLPVDPDKPEFDSPSFMFSEEQWPMTVTQYNLIGYFVRNNKHSKMMRTVSLFGCTGLLDQRWCMRSCFSSQRITELVLQHLKDGWSKKIQGADSYRRFNDSRGHWALKGNQDLDLHLDWSIEGPFDESVLIWHIATDFCFFEGSVSDHRCAFAEIPSISSIMVSIGEHGKYDPYKHGTGSKCKEESRACKAVLCRQISNYMMYLLFVNPEMLLPGTRRNLFTAAYNELKKILDDSKPSQQNPQTQSQRKPTPVKEKELMKTLITTMENKSRKAPEDESKKGSEEESNGGSKGSFIDDAWTIAQGLLRLNDDEKMWKVIQGVWVEMLCFSAGRCRGYLHAKSLSSGGEFLSYVWLLMSYMGMETFTERLQRDELPSCQDKKTSTDPPASDTHNGTASSNSEINTHAPPPASEVHTSAPPSTPEVYIDMF